jgi:hypothetical protein
MDGHLLSTCARPNTERVPLAGPAWQKERWLWPVGCKRVLGRAKAERAKHAIDLYSTLR